ncbi:hypothetical protein, partial [Klebsiella pneumoniae]|uniref:hypothetical protein n=1 Tax=Klebsiella pneumoniae TaxID=573 RepID=UPI00371A47E7
MTVLATATLLASAAAFPALAETLTDWKCTGNSDIPWDEQVAGCTKAIKSGHFTGPVMAAALYDRG